MICKNCGAYFVRPPCPSCGQGETTEAKKRKEESTVRPSTLRGGSAVNPKIRTEEQDSAEEVPSFARYSQVDEGDGTSGSSEIKEETTTRPSQISKSEKATDVAYRNKVKRTVSEAIKLLEQLIEDE